MLHRHCNDSKTANDGSVGSTHGKRRIIKEPSAVKVCIVARTDRIVNIVGWSSRQLTSRGTTNLNSKEKGDKSLFVKREGEVTEDVYDTALQRLSDMAKS